VNSEAPHARCYGFQPMDSDIDLSRPADRAELRPNPFPVLLAISAGGVAGALARYGLGIAWPHPPPGFPWATWTINVSGSFLIGVLMTAIDRWHLRHRLLRPFLGVGFLGGYTTFSTSVVDVQHSPPGIALLYLFGTLLGAVLAVWAGSALAGLGREPR
jgi:fluoride exporter